MPNLPDLSLDDAPIAGDTRERLLEAGLRLFSARGFDSVSTRELARAADANIAAIAYHFGGKQELYHAVVRQLVIDTEPTIAPVAAKVRAAIEAAGEYRGKLSQVAAMLVKELLVAFTLSERMQLRAGLILREYSHPSSAFDIMFKGRIEPLHKAISALTAAALDRAPDDPATVVRAHAIVGQIIIFFLARIVLFTRLEWTDYGPEEFALVCRETTQSVIASLGLPPLPSPEVAS